MNSIIATPPGRTILDLLIDRNFFMQDFAAAMNLDIEQIYDLITGNFFITSEIALRLEKTLDVPTKFWLNLEDIYRKKLKGV